MADIQKITPFLMFQNGRAEEALNFYIDLFGGETIMIDRYGPDMPEMDGKVRLAMFVIAGQQINIIDSSIRHEFDFTPSFSLYYRASTIDELDRLWEELLTDGAALMPKDDYGFGPFGWLNDRYGISWQLSLDPGTTGQSTDK